MKNIPLVLLGLLLTSTTARAAAPEALVMFSHLAESRTRLLCSFSGQSIDPLDFDRATGANSRSFVRQLPEGELQLTCKRPEQQPSPEVTICISVRSRAGQPTIDSCSTGSEDGVTRAGQKLTFPDIELQVQPATLTMLVRKLLTTQPADPKVERAGGSIGPAAKVPEIVLDTLDILADIAVDRARRRSFAILKDRVIGAVCQSLKREHLYSSQGTESGQLALPSTCDALRHLELPELGDAARILGAALRRDAVTLVLDFAWSELGRNSPAGQLLTLVEELLQDSILARREPTIQEAQMFIFKLAAADPLKSQLPESLLLTLAVLGQCNAKGCDARQVVRLLEEAPQELAPTTLTLEERLSLTALVLRGLEVLRPEPGTSPQEVTRNAIDFIFLALKHTRPSGGWADREPVHTTIVGLVTGDVTATWKGLLGLLRKRWDQHDEAWRALTILEPIISAMLANAQLLKQGEQDPARAEALRDARRATLESLIDVMTDRRERAGERVVSLGASVGPTLTLATKDRSADWEHPLDLDLGLPMGLALQQLPSSRYWKFGWQVQASLIDLGVFASSDDPSALEWNDFVILGLQAGVLWGNSSDALTLAFEGRYAPGGSGAGEASLLLLFGYFVPFLDLN